MDQNEIKKAVAEAAADDIKKRLEEQSLVIGVGTGSTTNHFIDCLADARHDISATVASSEESARRLKAAGIPVMDLNAVDEISIYVDGADETDEHLQLIKGGGGALTREKMQAAVAREFLCIVDDSKLVSVLGRFPLPVEVIPMARSHVGRQIVKLGGDPVYRDGFVTDNGNIILDIHHLTIMQPLKLEQQLNQITGVVTNGLFAARRPDRLLVGSSEGVKTLLPD